MLVNDTMNTLFGIIPFPLSSVATPPNKMALFPGKRLTVKELYGGKRSPVLTGTVHLPDIK